MALADERKADAAADLVAEALEVTERLITSPGPGRFHPAVAEGDEVDPGQEIGKVIRSTEETTVRSPFKGLLMGLLVLPGERVRAGQPVAWLLRR